MRLIVIGGGCYGSMHTRQLLKAQRRGKIACERFELIDHNPACQALAAFADEPLVRVVRMEWDAYLRAYLDTVDETTDDRLVPAPFAPHLLFDWLRDAVARDVPEASVRRAPCDLTLGLPYEHTAEPGNRFISAAGWLCPVTCIEPKLCPAIHGERTWELGEIVRTGPTRAGESYSSVELFTCRHYAWGVGTIPIADLVRARARVVAALRAGQAQRVVVGTVSSCHGVLGVLEAAPSPT